MNDHVEDTPVPDGEATERAPQELRQLGISTSSEFYRRVFTLVMDNRFDEAEDLVRVFRASGWDPGPNGAVMDAASLEKLIEDVRDRTRGRATGPPKATYRSINPPAERRHRISETLRRLALQCFAVIFLVIGAGNLGAFPAHWQNVTAAASAPVCPAASPTAEDCLRPVLGQITDIGSFDRINGGRRFKFVPAHDPEQEVWVSLANDGRVPFHRTVVALYWKSVPVAFETPHGREVPLDSDLGTRTNLLWWGLALTCLGAVGWVGLHARKYDEITTPLPRWIKITFPICYVGMLGSFCAIFPSSEPVKLIVFGIGGAIGATLAITKM